MMRMAASFLTVMICATRIFASSSSEFTSGVTSRGSRSWNDDPSMSSDQPASHWSEKSVNQNNHLNNQEAISSRRPSNRVASSLPKLAIQDPTGFNLVNHDFLRAIPADLAGQDLIHYHNAFFEAHKTYLYHLVNLRRRAMIQARKAVSQMQDTVMLADRDSRRIDFTKFANGKSPFNDYCATIQSLASQESVMERISKLSRDIALRFKNNIELTDEPTMQSSNQSNLQFDQDVRAIYSWTRPNSLGQIDQLIAIYTRMDPVELIKQEDQNAYQIGKRLFF